MKNKLNKIINIRTEYIMGLLLLTLVVVVGSFSYALYTTSNEKKGALSIVTGNLNSLIESSAFNDSKQVTVAANTTTFTIKLSNPNSIQAKFNLYYSTSDATNTTIDYLCTGDAAPGSDGIVLPKYGDSGYYKNIKIVVTNKSTTTAITITFGSDVTLYNQTLTIPSGKSVIALFATGVDTLLAKANPSTVTEYTTATSDQQKQMFTFSHTAGTQQAEWTTDELMDYRYVGASPNNYVTFNGQTWRIIGVFTVENSDGTKSKKIKIIGDTIGYYSWDSSDSSVNSGFGISEWSQADSMSLLNSLYWNATSGNCYNSSNNATKSCDFSTIGLTSAAKSLISPTKYYLGDISSVTTDLINKNYVDERGTAVISATDGVTRTTSWIGNVALMYMSDFGYATGGGSTANQQACLAKEIYNWYSSSYSDCCNNDWLYNSSYQWTLNNVGSQNDGFFIRGIGAAIPEYYHLSRAYTLRPNIYLKSDVSIIEGDGTSTSPYVLSE